MISHANVGVSNFDRAMRFYSVVLAPIGLELKFYDRADQWAGWKLPDHDRPLFIINKPFNDDPHAPGNGQMIALLAPSREAVEQCYHLAVEQGARDEGRPGLRPHYHADYYGAYFRDLDGNKLCICCHLMYS